MLDDAGQQRAFLRKIGILIACVAVFFLAYIRIDVWFFGVPVQVFEPHSTLFSSEGMLLCARPYGTPGRNRGAPELTYLHMGTDLLIFDRRESLLPQPATKADLRRGQRLRLWEQSAPLFSYPSQIFATRIVIEEDDVTEPLDCAWKGLES